MPIKRTDSTVDGVPVATLTIDHAPVNVLDMGHCRGLVAELQKIKHDDDARVVVLRGEGRCFSTGVDIQQHTEAVMPDLLPAFHAIFHAMLDLNAVTIAAVHSYCLGGAAELAFACDRVVAERSSRLGFPEITVGCYPPVAIPLMAQRVGQGRATQMIMSGKEVAVDELHQWGAVDRVCEKGELDAAMAEELKIYAGKSPTILGMTAKLLHDELKLGWGGRIDALEKAYLTEVLPHADAQEGIAAFQEKRAPKWLGVE